MPSTLTRRATASRDGEVVDRGEVPHLGDVGQVDLRLQAEPGGGDVTGDELDATRRVRVGRLDLGDPCPAVSRCWSCTRQAAVSSGRRASSRGSRAEPRKPGKPVIRSVGTRPCDQPAWATGSDKGPL